MIQTDRFLKIGYIWPQTELSMKSLEPITKKLAQKLYDQNLHGYVTILLTVSRVSTKNLKVCIDKVVPYYDEFMAAYEMINLMTPSNPADPYKTAVIIPRMNGLSFSPDLTSLKFFERCRERNIQFDLKNKSGTLFLMSDAIDTGNLGFVSIGRYRN